ncbi:MAG: hypothetical protein ACTSXP_19310 [Promethearchaeota archaeon]
MKSSSMLVFACLLSIGILSAFTLAASPQKRDNLRFQHVSVSDWSPPPTDNVYYSEWMEYNIFNDGSVGMRLELVDDGVGNVSFPIELDTPANLSSTTILDMRARIALVQHEGFPMSCGPVTTPFRNDMYIFGDEDSIVPQVYLEFAVLVDHFNNLDIVRDLLDNKSTEVSQVLLNATDGLKKYSDTVQNSFNNSRWLIVEYRDFASSTNLKNAIAYLLDNCLPIGTGLAQVDLQKFLNSRYKSIQIAATWDGVNESGSQSTNYDVEPPLPGNQEQLDERWEYIAGLLQYQDHVLNLTNPGTNTLYLKNLTNNNILGVNPVANFSQLDIRFFHGCNIIAARPNFASSPHYRATYEVDLISDPGEVNYQFPSNANINFTVGNATVPVIKMMISADNYIVNPGQNVSLSYNITNLGSSPVYNVQLVDALQTYGGPFTILTGDSDSNGDIDAFWQKIEAGESKIHAAVINCGGTIDDGFSTDAFIQYHASTYTDTSEWLRNPNDYYNGYQLRGSNIVVFINSSTPLLTVEHKLTNISARAGDMMNVTLIVKNVGNQDAVDVSWMAPIFGINVTNASGTIDRITPGEEVQINTTFIVDCQFRLLGNFVEEFYDWSYGGGFVGWDLNGNPFVLNAYGFKLNIFPSNGAYYGPLIQAWRETRTIHVDGVDYLSVTLHAKNIGTSTAYNINMADYIPLSNYSVMSGDDNTNSHEQNMPVWNEILPGMEVMYTYLLKVPDDAPSIDRFAMLITSYSQVNGYNWFDGNIRSSINTFTTPGAAESSAGPDATTILLWTFGIGMFSAIGIAVLLGLLLLNEKGKITLSKPRFKGIKLKKSRY